MNEDGISDKHLTKRAQRTENTRRRILDASIRLFMEQGYEKTTTRQILNEVGILNGSLYNIYKSKEDIFSDIVINALEEAMRHASDSLPENTPVRVRLAYIFHMQLYFAARSQRIAELLTIAHERWGIHKRVVEALTAWVKKADVNEEMYTDSYDFPMKLDACTGWVRHMGRFYENRIYAFALDAQLTKGQVEVLLLDQNKQPLLQLSSQNPTQSIHLDGETSRYYLQWKFHSASGKCELHW